jgi:hypothetical protein
MDRRQLETDKRGTYHRIIGRAIHHNLETNTRTASHAHAMHDNWSRVVEKPNAQTTYARYLYTYTRNVARAYELMLRPLSQQVGRQ